MPLFDHFHEPLTRVSGWASFDHAWVCLTADQIRGCLPPRVYADPYLEFGVPVRTWFPDPSPGITLTDRLEVQVWTGFGIDRRLLGVVEFLSPANKDRPEARTAFVAKCRNHLKQGVGLVLVDVVTEKHFNLHNELMERIGSPGEQMPGHLYATGYRPTGKNGSGRLDVWVNELAVGRPLPTVPLWLYGGISVPVRLEETYDRTCRELRITKRLADRAEALRRRAEATP